MSEPTPVEPATQTPSQPDIAPVATATPVAEPVAALIAEPAKSWVNEDGSFNREVFADKLGEHSSFDKYGNIEEYVKGSINQSKLFGKKVDDFVETDDPAAKAIRDRIRGVSTSADDYQITIPEEFDSLPQAKKDRITEFFKEDSKWALENEISKGDYEKMATRDMKRSIEMFNTNEEAVRVDLADREAALQKRQGNDYENNTEKSYNIADFLNLPGFKEVIKQNPELREEFFNGLNQFVSEDKIIEAGQEQTLATVQDELDSLEEKMLDPKFDGMSHMERAGNPEYKRFLSRRMLLTEQINRS